MKTSLLANVRAAIAEAIDDDIHEARHARDSEPHTAEADDFADDLHRAVYAPAEGAGNDGPWIDFDPREEEVDEEDREHAARNFNDDTEGYTVEGEPDGSAIELRTVSAWDRHLDDLAADREAQERYELGYYAF